MHEEGVVYTMVPKVIFWINVIVAIAVVVVCVAM